MPRLTKFYSPIQQSAQALVEKIYALVSPRPAGLCNFLDAPELEQFLAPAAGDGERLRVVYRSYATLHFVFVVDSAESELGILDLIQVRACVRVCRPVRRKPLPLPSLFHSVPYPAPHRALQVSLGPSHTSHQVFVESLDGAFENVCELDLVFHFDEVRPASRLGNPPSPPDGPRPPRTLRTLTPRHTTSSPKSSKAASSSRRT